MSIALLLVWPKNLLCAEAQNQKTIQSNHISQLIPIKLRYGVNKVEFWGVQEREADEEGKKFFVGGKTSYLSSFHESGIIVRASDGSATASKHNVYFAAAPWIEPLDLMRLDQSLPTVPAGYALEDIPDGENTLKVAGFYQGIWEEHPQTFMATAERLVDAPPPDPAVVQILIYYFEGGSPRNYGEDGSGPSFFLLTGYKTKVKYCDAASALSQEMSLYSSNKDKSSIKNKAASSGCEG